MLGKDQEVEGIYKYKKRFKKYDSEDPIFIKNENGEIQTLEQIPNLQMDLTDEYQYGAYIIKPQLREQGISEEKISQIQEIIESYQKPENMQESEQKKEKNRMNLLRTAHGEMDYEEKFNQFFGEER